MRAVIIAALLASVALGIPAGSPSGTYKVSCTPGGASSNYPACVINPSAGAAGTDAGMLVYAADLMNTGWDNVTVTMNTTSAGLNATEKYFALAYLEGYVTFDRIYNNYQNTVAGYVAQYLTKDVAAWIENNLAFVRGTFLGKEDAYSMKVAQALAQVDGLADGFAAACAAKGCTAAEMASMNRTVMYWYNFQSEVGDIYTAYNAQSTLQLTRKNSGHCSALIKVLSDDIYFSHVTWNGFNTMMRQYKTYRMEGSSFVTMSSYPGMTSSMDDWYINGYGLAIMETTNSVFNNQLFVDNLKNKYSVVPEFIRVMAASFLATSSQAWTDTFASYNSGTYNNQWMVVDMKAFRPGKPLPKNTFRVLETLPGTVVTGDETALLNNQGYFASYNIPFFPQVYTLSGNAAKYATNGDFFSYTKYARAQIFARNHTMVTDIASMKAMMRYNNFKHDPLSRITNCTGATGNVCNPPYSAMLAIASRGDLNPPGGEASYGPNYHYLTQRDHCGTDVKIATYKGIMQSNGNFRAQVISGPTSYQQPVFRFSTAPALIQNAAHAGLPDTYDFPFVDAVSMPRTAPQPYTTTSENTNAIGIAIAIIGGIIVLFTIVVLVVMTIKKRTAQQGDAYRPIA